MIRTDSVKKPSSGVDLRSRKRFVIRYVLLYIEFHRLDLLFLAIHTGTFSVVMDASSMMGLPRRYPLAIVRVSHVILGLSFVVISTSPE